MNIYGDVFLHDLFRYHQPGEEAMKLHGDIAAHAEASTAAIGTKDHVDAALGAFAAHVQHLGDTLPPRLMGDMRVIQYDLDRACTYLREARNFANEFHYASPANGALLAEAKQRIMLARFAANSAIALACRP